MVKPPVVAFDWLLLRGRFTPIQNQIEHTLADTVRDAVESLSQEDQDILLARFYERLSYSQLAVRIGKNSKGAAWRVVRHSLHRLEVALAERGVTFKEENNEPDTSNDL